MDSIFRVHIILHWIRLSENQFAPVTSRCGDMITIRILPCYREYFLATPIDSLRNPEKYQSPIFSVIDIVYPSILYVGYVLHVSM